MFANKWIQCFHLIDYDSINFGIQVFFSAELHIVFTLRIKCSEVKREKCKNTLVMGYYRVADSCDIQTSCGAMGIITNHAENDRKTHMENDDIYHLCIVKDCSKNILKVYLIVQLLLKYIEPVRI